MLAANTGNQVLKGFILAQFLCSMLLRHGDNQVIVHENQGPSGLIFILIPLRYDVQQLKKKKGETDKTS